MAAAAFNGRNFQQNLQKHLNLPVTILPNTQFLVGRYNPIPNPEPDKRYVMETFYRNMRHQFDLLMDGDAPAGGQWNFDKENRKKLPKMMSRNGRYPSPLMPSPNKSWPKSPRCQMG
jgi:deoxyribodipyrimidine photolyase-related protein